MSNLNFNELPPVVQDFLITYGSSVVGTLPYTIPHYFQNRTILGFPIQYKNPSVWMRGWPSFAVLGPALSLTTQLTAFESITRFMKKRTNETKLNSLEFILAATVSSGISGPFSNAVHNIVLHQENTGRSFGDIFKLIYNSKGGFSRGIGWTISRQMVFMNIYTSFQLFLEKHIYENIKNANASYFASILFSSVMIAITTQPFMVVTANLYADQNKEIYKNGFQVIRKILNEKGFCGLYSGLSYRIVGVVFGLTCIKLTENKLRQLTKTHDL